MAKSTYKVNTGAILGSELLLEATREELRVLTYIIASEGRALDIADIAEGCKVSSARAGSALGLWTGGGVLERCSPTGESESKTTVSYEFAERVTEDFIEMTAEEVAREIRNGELRDVIEEIAELVGKPTLNEGEVRALTDLYAQLGLSAEYIRILANYLHSTTQKFTVMKLKNKAKRLSDENISDVELLEKYIEDATSEGRLERAFKYLFGGDIWNRRLSVSEKRYCKRWFCEFGFSSEILDIARDIALQRTGEANLKYMDICLTAWHEAGCKTVEEVNAHREQAALARTDDAPAPKQRRTTKRTQTQEAPLYGDFTTEDALMRALERSYGTEEKS